MTMRRVPNLTLSQFNSLLEITPMITVDAIIADGKGRVLLEKRAYPPFKGFWHLPGGFSGYKEKLTDAVKRKTRQETGLKIKVIKYVGYYDDPRQDPRGSIIDHAFLAKAIGGKLKMDGLRWFDKVPKNTVPFQRKILKDAGFS